MKSHRAMAVCGIFLLSGCTALPWARHGTKHASSVLPPSGPRRVGRVALVNAELGFVLVDVGSLYAPQAGTALKSFHGTEESGVLAVSPEKQRPFIVADIVKGAPKVGDDVEE